MNDDEDLDTFLDNPFHGAALVAFVEQAVAEQSMPSMEPTRQRAYRIFEDYLAALPHNRRGS